jgi:uncharacterized glyoxalase superfamily protein PhnB/uncharacterized protein YciI
MRKTIAVFLRPGSKWNPDKPVREQAFWDDHARFMDALFDAGIVVLGGPFADGGGSMVILETDSVEAARAIYQNDPWTKQDILVVGEAKEWTIFLDRQNLQPKRPLKRLEVMMNRSMPPSVIIPELAYADVREAVEWLCRTFGFSERLRIGSHRAQLSFGDGSVIVTERRVDQGTGSSEGGVSRPASNHSVMARVADVDSHYERSRQCGVRIIHPPTDYPYGERQYTVEDLGGHKWTFSQTIADADPKVWGGELIESA